MSGPKTSEYTLTPEQRANLDAQNRCDNDILACISRINALKAQVCASLSNVTVYTNTTCESEITARLTSNLKSKLSELKRLEKDLQDRFSPLSQYRRSSRQILTADELMRKQNILEKLKALNVDVITLLKEIDDCKKLSEQLKAQISTDMQDNVSDAYGLSWDLPEQPKEKSLAEKVKAELENLLSQPALSSKLKDNVRNAVSSLNEMSDNNFISAFNTVTVVPLVRECKKYISNVNTYGDEFHLLEAKYRILCAEADIIPVEFDVSQNGIDALRSEITKLELEALQNKEQEYIADAIDEVMVEMGYNLVGSRDVEKKNGKRFRDELYTFGEGTAVNIRYDKAGRIAMELGGLDSVDRIPTADEAFALENEMHTFCDRFVELEKRLEARGIVCKNRISHLPPTADNAQIINTSDYDMKAGVGNFKKQRWNTSNKKSSHSSND